MKKVVSIFLVILVVGTLLSAVSCGKKENGDKASGGDEVKNLAAEEGKKQVYGEVSEVIGNMISLKEMKLPEGGIDIASMLEQFGGAGGNINIQDFSGKSPEEIQDMLKERGIEIPTGEDGQISFGNFGNRGNGQRGQTATDENGEAVTRSFNIGEIPTGEDGRPAIIERRFSGEPETGADGEPVTDADGNPVMKMPERETETDENGQPATDENGDPVYKRNARGGLFQREYTGETLELFIPVGIPVNSVSLGEDGKVAQTEVAVETLKSGDTLLFSYAEDGVSIEKVTLIPSMGGRMANFNVSGGNGDGPVFNVSPEGNGMFFFDSGEVPAGEARPIN